MNVSISGTTLKSLRSRYKANLKAASKMTGIDEHTLESWESQGTELNITEAKRLAKSYHSHWSVFLLKDKVKEIKDVQSHRAGYGNNVKLSHATIRAYEIAHRFLNISNDIDGQKVDEQILNLCSDKSLKTDPLKAAHAVRKITGIDNNTLAAVKGGKDKVYQFWVEVVSSLGVYVSELDMPVNETKAFLIIENSRALIAISKEDRYVYSKMFSLLHEVGHLVRGDESAACEFKLYANRIDDTESWCNKFASELAAPDSLVLSDDRVNKLQSSDDVAGLIRLLAIKFKVSFTVMMYKMRNHKKITKEQKNELVEFYEKVIKPKEYYVPESNDIKLGKSYYVSKAVKEASPLLVREVADRQLQGDLTFSQAAKLLNTKPRYLSDIKQKVGFGS